MSQNIRSFRDLNVYQQAFEAAIRIYDLSERFPSKERFRVTDQILRSSSAVAALIAEAWRRRRYEKAWISKLNESEGEASETQHWLSLAQRRHYITVEEFKTLDDEYEHIQQRLIVMINQSADWVIR